MGQLDPPRRWRRLGPAGWLGLLWVLAAALLRSSHSVEATGEPAFMRGMTVSCPRDGEIWGTEQMREALRELRPLGVEWVAIHPYAGVRRDGTIRFRPAAETSYLAQAAAISRQEGVQLFWKPHLAYWGSFEWRGDIAFGDDEAAWQRFFSGYRDFILDQARFAEQAGLPLLAVGVELEATTGRQELWRQLIADVRQVYHGRITYAANWDRLEQVPFWDALDFVGVQAYFPLSEVEDPDVASLEAGWQPHLAALEALSARLHGKPVLFTEIGYNRSEDAARRPWDYQVRDSERTRSLRRRLIEVALAETDRRPYLRGVFWWKWMPGPYPGRSNFSMRDPEAMDALRHTWGASFAH